MSSEEHPFKSSIWERREARRLAGPRSHTLGKQGGWTVGNAMALGRALQHREETGHEDVIAMTVLGWACATCKPEEHEFITQMDRIHHRREV